MKFICRTRVKFKIYILLQKTLGALNGKILPDAT